MIVAALLLSAFIEHKLRRSDSSPVRRTRARLSRDGGVSW